MRNQLGERNNNFKHGLSRTPEYLAWANMKCRCYNPRYRNYRLYGGRGIQVCDRWLDSFENFKADIGSRPARGYLLDRIDNDLNYEPGNVRWVTLADSNNNKRNNRYVEYKGTRMTLARAIVAAGAKKDTVHARLRIGWPLVRALEEPNRLYRGF